MELRILTYAGQTYQEAIKVFAAEFEALTGAAVQIVSLPAPYGWWAMLGVAQADIASQFKDVAHYFIASEGFSESHSYLEDLKKWGRTSPEKLQSPKAVAEEILAKNPKKTLSVVDLQQIPQYDDSIKAFGQEILKVKKEDLDELKGIIDRSQRFAQLYPYEKSPLVDIKNLSENLDTSLFFREEYPGLVDSARSLKDHLRDVVVDEKHTLGGKEDLGRTLAPLPILGLGVAALLAGASGGAFLAVAGGVLSAWSLYTNGLLYEDVKDAGGLTLFLPVRPYYNGNYRYNPQLTFWKETGWEKVMEHLAE
ncbi:MAG: hypothetical protein HYU64_14445 [Armatimonadetes bacterium]|nr:hypothetical protein [Armatimonadota bacterium]